RRPNPPKYVSAQIEPIRGVWITQGAFLPGFDCQGVTIGEGVQVLQGVQNLRWLAAPAIAPRTIAPCTKVRLTRVTRVTGFYGSRYASSWPSPGTGTGVP